ncbi:MAG TPA: NAD(P)-dependent oxidoreductase [Solirubrobacteraceae bacterium]|nr:NAD(P)-dependent oxidoreductase [Solirubrobacteraceae bacterium]
MILVTGGFGSIGANTALALADLGEDVVVTRRREAAPPSFLEGRVAVEQADLADLDALRAIGDRYEIAGIVHLAAVALEEPDPIAFMRRNTAMLLNALEVARTSRVRRFAVASSIGVYHGTSGPRLHEDLPLAPATAPNSILAFKRSVEAIAPQVLHGAGIGPVILRIGTIWGPLGHPDSPFFPIPRLISATVRGEAPDLTPPRPPGFADDGGDRCYVKDCGRAIALLMRADTLAHDTYNVSSGRPVANREFVAAVNAAVPGAEASLEPGRDPGAPADDPYLDIARLTRDTGFEPAFDVSAGVADYVAWLRENPA